MIRRRPLPLFLLLALAGAWISVPPAVADATSPPARLDVRYQSPVRKKLSPAVIVRVSTASGSPLAGATVQIVVDGKLFGGRAVLGEATTDATGVGSVPIVPTRSRYEVRARFVGNDQAGAAEAVRTFTVPATDIQAADRSQKPPLSGVADVMPRVLVAVVVLLWIALLAGTVSCVRSIRHEARTSPSLSTAPSTGGTG